MAVDATGGKTILQHISNNNQVIADALVTQQKELDDVNLMSMESSKAIRELKARNDEIVNELANEREARIRLEVKAQRLPQGAQERSKSPGEQFVQSAEYKAVAGEQSMTKLTPFVSVKVMETKASFTGDSPNNVPGYLYTPTRLPEVIVPGIRKTHVRDVLTVIPTQSGALEFIRENQFLAPSATGAGFQNNAAKVAESGLKPKSSLAVDVETVRVATLAHWIPVTRQIIADAPQIQQYIDTRLLYGLRLEEDKQLLYGTPNLQQMLGIYPMTQTGATATTSGYTGPWVQEYTQTVGESMLDAIRNAMASAESSNYTPNAIVLNPLDWALIEVLKTQIGSYVIGNVGGAGGSNYPNVGSAKELWGIPVIVTTAINQGQFLTGAFDMAASLYDREQAGIRISEHVYFTSNILVLLCEERLGLAVFRPDAFVWGAFSGNPANGY